MCKKLHCRQCNRGICDTCFAAILTSCRGIAFLTFVWGIKALALCFLMARTSHKANVCALWCHVSFGYLPYPLYCVHRRSPPSVHARVSVCMYAVYVCVFWYYNCMIWYIFYIIIHSTALIGDHLRPYVWGCRHTPFHRGTKQTDGKTDRERAKNFFCENQCKHCLLIQRMGWFHLMLAERG